MMFGHEFFRSLGHGTGEMGNRGKLRPRMHESHPNSCNEFIRELKGFFFLLNAREKDNIRPMAANAKLQFGAIHKSFVNSWP